MSTERLLSYFLKTIEYSFYALFFLIPLVLSNNTSELFELNKMWLTWIITILVLIGWGGKMIIEKKVAIQRTPLDIPIILFLVSQTISTIISQDQYVSFWGYYSRFNGGLLSTITYIFLYYAFVSNIKDLEKLNDKKPFDSFVIGSLLIGALSIIALSIALAAPHGTGTGAPIIFYGSLILALITSIIAFRPGFFYRLIGITLFSGVVVTLWGIPSHFGIDPTCELFRGTFDVSCWTEAFDPPSRIFSTLGQPAWLAAYLSFLIPIAGAFSLKFIRLPHIASKKLFLTRHVLYFLIAMILYIGLLYTNTRAGFLGFWIGNIVFFAGLMALFSQKFKSFLTLFLIYNLSFVFLTFLIGIPITQLQKFTYPVITQKTQEQPIQKQTTESPKEQETQTGETNAGVTDSGNIRLNVWQGALDAWKENPIFGTGVETFAFAYYKYKPVSQNLTSEWDFLYNKAHNEYLNYLATTGIVGLGTYLLLIMWFLLFVLIKAVKEHWFFDTKAYEGEHKRLFSRILVLSLVGGYLSILISNFFGFSVVIVNLFFFLTPALVFYLTGQIKQVHMLRIPTQQKTDLMIEESPTGFQITGIVGLILVGIILILVLLRYWNADTAYALGANLNRVGQYTESYNELKNAIALRPNEPTFKDEFAYTNAAIGAAYLLQNDATTAGQFISEAKRLGDEVVTSHPNNVVFWKNRVRSYYLLSQADPQFLPLALESIRQADTLAPNDAKILYNHGVILGQMGKSDEAIDVLTKTISIKPDFRDARFALALFYRDKATNGVQEGPVVDSEMQKKATEQLDYILTNLSSEDQQVKETLESWNK